VRTTFSANDDPVDAGQIETDRAEQGLDAEKPHGGGDFAQPVGSESVGLVLHADAHPNVRWPGEAGGDAAHPIGPLGEDLIGMLRRLRHNSEGALDEVEWDVLVKEITHAVDKDSARCPPAAREVEELLMERQSEPVPIPGHAHRLQSVGERVRVAMIAAWADMSASRHKVPGSVRPLDSALCGHVHDSLTLANDSCRSEALENHFLVP
jgi:hypothetical protein